MISLLFLVSGLLVGSFANVCILRLPKNEDILLKRSLCFNCKKQIPWFFNIPIFSYLYLAGYSNCCGKKISRQYPIIELTTGILFLINSIFFDFFQAITISIIFFVLLLIIVIDFYERVIFTKNVSHNLRVKNPLQLWYQIFKFPRAKNLKFAS